VKESWNRRVVKEAQDAYRANPTHKGVRQMMRMLEACRS